MENRRMVWGVFLSLISAAGFGAAAPLAKGILNAGVSQFLMLSIRFGGSAIVIWMYLLSNKKQIEWRIKSKGEGMIYLILGSVNFVNAYFYYLAIQYITVSLHIVIFYTYPFFVVLLSLIFYKERIDKRTAISLLLAFLGICITVFSKKYTYSILGMSASFSAAIIFSIYLMGLGHQKIKGKNSLVIVAYTNAVSAILYILATFLRNEASFEYFTSGVMMRLLALVIIGTALAYVTLAHAVRLIGATKVSIISTLEPVESIFLSVIFLGEVLRFNQVIGAICVIFAIIYMSYKKDHSIKSLRETI